mgnify:CR=1 FL=1
MLDIEKVRDIVDKYKNDLVKEWYDFQNMSEDEYDELLLNFATFVDINFFD